MQDFQAIFTRPSISIICNAGLIHHHHEAYSETTGIISTTLMDTCLSLQCFTESTHESLIAKSFEIASSASNVFRRWCSAGSSFLRKRIDTNEEHNAVVFNWEVWIRRRPKGMQQRYKDYLVIAEAKDRSFLRSLVQCHPKLSLPIICNKKEKLHQEIA